MNENETQTTPDAPPTNEPPVDETEASTYNVGSISFRRKAGGTVEIATPHPTHELSAEEWIDAILSVGKFAEKNRAWWENKLQQLHQSS